VEEVVETTTLRKEEVADADESAGRFAAVTASTIWSGSGGGAAPLRRRKGLERGLVGTGASMVGGMV
jgi:hypothetical protein